MNNITCLAYTYISLSTTKRLNDSSIEPIVGHAYARPPVSSLTKLLQQNITGENFGNSTLFLCKGKYDV